MGIQIIGNGGVIAEVDGTTFRSLRVTSRPPEFGSLGCYRKGLVSGTMAAGLAANANVFSFRWGDATRLALVTQVRIGAGSIVAFAAGFASFRLVLGRSFSASHTGGTAGTLTGNNNKLRTSMGTMLLTDVRISSTAALAGGTVTLDTDGIAALTGSVGATAGTPIINPGSELFNTEGQSEYPLVFAQNEGFVIQATVPATGTWTFGVDVKWYEVNSY
jgi:hypothetical protein